MIETVGLFSYVPFSPRTTVTRVKKNPRIGRKIFIIGIKTKKNIFSFSFT